MNLIARSNVNSLSLVAKSNKENSFALGNPSFVEVWFHRVNEGIESAQLLGTSAPGSTLKVDYNPQSKDDLIFYLLAKDALGRENTSRLIDAPQKRFSFSNPKDQPETSSFIITTDKNFYALDCTSDDLTGTLPNASTCFDWEVTFKKIDSSANTVTIAAPSGEVIDDALSITIINQYDAVTLRSDGENYQIKSDYNEINDELEKDAEFVRITESGDVRITQSGETRITE